MKIRVNGTIKETTAKMVVDLLAELDLLPTQVAIEHNGIVLFRHELAQTPVRNNDHIEIIRVVAGG